MIVPIRAIIHNKDFEHPLIIPPKKYHISRNTISSISVTKLIYLDLILLSSDDKK